MMIEWVWWILHAIAVYVLVGVVVLIGLIEFSPRWRKWWLRADEIIFTYPWIAYQKYKERRRSE